MFLFSGGCPSAYIKQSLFIHSTSGNGGKPVKKIPASATVLPTMKVEVQSPYNRISISHNRKGHKAFAVFLLSFLVGKCRRTIIGVKCRSPPFNLDFYVFKDSDWLEEKRMACSPGICVIVNTYPCLLLITGLPSASKRSNVNWPLTNWSILDPE